MLTKRDLSLLQSITHFTGENPAVLKSYTLNYRVKKSSIIYSLQIKTGSRYQAVAELKFLHPDSLIKSIDEG